jgi:hypothetical protein
VKTAGDLNNRGKEKESFEAGVAAWVSISQVLVHWVSNQQKTETDQWRTKDGEG